MKPLKMWALVSPTGKIIKETIWASQDDAFVSAYSYLLRRAKWAGDFWKQWASFRRERERRGWFVRRVEVRVAR